jgi:rfaE bifunctional protein kinase chain/domain
VGVVGDLALDGYWYADMARSLLSRETPHFPRPIVREFYSPGAGANVAHNLHVVGAGHVVAFSVLGDDWRGRILVREMARRGVDTGSLIISPDRGTNAYIKPMLRGYESEQEDARLDFENAEPLSAELERTLIDQISHALPELHAVLVADQLEVNGVITDNIRESLNALAEEYPDKVFAVDSRRRIGLFRRMVLKPNRMEAARALRPLNEPHAPGVDELGQIGKTLSSTSGRPVFLTLSENGVLLCSTDTFWHIPAAPARPPLDPVGAGDTFVSAMATALAADATPLESGVMANLAAAVVIEKLNQTGTASPAEILERYDLALGAESTP